MNLVYSFLIFVMITFVYAQEKTVLGFDVSNSIIPVDQIKSGGPPRDGIPAIFYPQFASVADYSFFSEDQRVLGVYYNGVAKAYPIGILNWHEIVNDVFDKQPVVITYCPLCGSGMAFDADFDGRRATFSVSGLLYNSDMLLYDRQSESLWSQIKSQAISGPYVGKKLKMIVTENTTLGAWKVKYPASQILTIETGYQRNYARTPYGNYADSPRLFFPVAHEDDRYFEKELVLGIEVNEKYKAYPFSELEKAGEKINHTFEGKNFILKYNSDNQSATIEEKDGNNYPAVTLYWFAWIAFNPQTEVFTY